MKETRKTLKQKLKISSLAALTSATVLTKANNDLKQLSDRQFETSHIAYIDEYKQAFKFSYVVKSILMIPLWFIGSILLKLLEPLKSFVLSFIFTFVCLCLIVLLIGKLLFPKLKIKDILSLKNILIIMLFSFLINISKYILLIINKDYLKYTILFYFLLGIICLCIVLLPLIRLAKSINNIYKSIS